MKQLHPRSVWLFFLSFVPQASIIIFGWWFYLAIKSHPSAKLGGDVSTLAIIMIIFIFLSYFWAKFSYKFYKYELTDIALKKEHGIIWKKYVTIPYDRIQNIDIYRGLFARILRLSDLQVQTAGGITKASYGAFAEGRLPGLDPKVAEELREELIKKTSRSKNQGL